MNLRDYLKEKHITQLQFGKLTGLSQVHVSRVLGGYERFSPEKALRVAEVTNFEVTPHELRPDIYPNPTDGLPVGCKANTQNAQGLIHENQA